MKNSYRCFHHCQNILTIFYVTARSLGWKKTLSMLGLPKETFVKIVTSEHAGANKPDPAGFQYIVDHYRDYSSSVYDLPAQAGKFSPATAGSNNTKFLMVGDRPLVDLAPAKALGMQTCLVWREKKPEEDFIDFSVLTVYDVPKILEIGFKGQALK